MSAQAPPPPAPAWPSSLGNARPAPISTTLAVPVAAAQRPQPPPDSPSLGGDSEADELDEEPYQRPLTAEEIAAQEAQKDALRTEFLRLARGKALGNAAHLDDDAALASLTIGQTQFEQLLRSHIASAGADTDDAAAMESELSALWSELPKQLANAAGEEGVTFASLIHALAGGGPSQPNSRRQSIDHGGELDVASPTGERSSSVWNGAPKPTEGLRAIFAPVRRSSIKGSPPVPTSARLHQKRHSDVGRGGAGTSAPNGISPQLIGFGARDRGQSMSSAQRHSLFVSRNQRSSGPQPPPPAAPAASALAAAGGPMASGCLDLADRDWTDLGWLVEAHPAAFSSAASSNGTAAAASSSTTLNPAASPASTLVSASALQICMQHYLSRWLNQHELNVISSMLKFVRGGGGGQPGSDLLSYEVLQNTIRHLHSSIRWQSNAAIIDPLPSFAQALGLMSSTDSPLPPLSTDELLQHLNAFSVLAPDASQELLQSFGAEILHSPSMLSLLLELKSVSIRHSRLEKEYSLLIASSQHLDSSHHDLSEQVPVLQAALLDSKREKEAMSLAVARAAEIEANQKALKSNYEKLQKRWQAAQEDVAALRSEIQLAAESASSSESDHAALITQEKKSRERIGALEDAMRDFSANAKKKQMEDATTIASLQDASRHSAGLYHDLLEKSQIFYRRLVAVGETAGLEPLGRAHEEGDSHYEHDEHAEGLGNNVLAGSLDRSMARSMMARVGSYPLSGDLDGLNLSADLDPASAAAAGPRTSQGGIGSALEIDNLRRQVAALTLSATTKDREIDRLHSEIDALQGKGARDSDPASAGINDSTPSDGAAPEDKGGCCCVVQ